MTSATLFCFAHRGYQQRASENTLQAIGHALELAVGGVEIDVWNIGGQLLVKHDRRLGRLIAGSELITEMRPEALRERPLPCGNLVPTLREVLELVGNSAQLNIELKGPHCAALLAREIRAFVHDRDTSYQQYIVSSFDHRQLYECLQLIPEVRRGVLIAGVPLDLAACTAPLKAYSLHTNVDFVNTDLIADARQRGLKNFVFTVNDPNDLILLATQGVDGVFTDEPQIVLDFNARTAAKRVIVNSGVQQA
ncbi:glycerophosphodiester phosphodiesterase [Microbulbifer sp. OS29]|uniref:Glycerophosphodiester phosphodiesterase n=1 Tax=Microbulbifer okhotskensis TaxID=2926617 RepID=A0A9X2EKE5_9GAMM|nr:glycerophosphodiester phosphodiesterase [Microbulbifer okhotskensis]MCO1333844.1 glycerophosphodiester phosphodiesterase [Microbulbifer okhotskensis]